MNPIPDRPWSAVTCRLSELTRRQAAVALGLLLAAGAWVGCADTRSSLHSSPLPWLTDLEHARTEAAKLKRPIMMLFTGSDWCPPCKALERYVLSTPEFHEFATNNVVLLMVDFPRGGNLTQSERARNDAVQRRFQIEGYPTLVFLDPSGREIRRDFGSRFQQAAGLISYIRDFPEAGAVPDAPVPPAPAPILIP